MCVIFKEIIITEILLGDHVHRAECIHLKNKSNLEDNNTPVGHTTTRRIIFTPYF